MDVLIVGAGPSGCKTGEIIAKKGYDVLILEEHSQIGKPVQCAGLVSHRIGKIPKEIILNKIKKARFCCEKEHFEVKSEKPVYVIDREKYDKFRARKAKEAGTRFKLNTRFLDFKNGKAITTKGNYQTKLLIGADGPNSMVAKKTGISLPNNLLFALQTRIKSDFNSDTVELWFGSKIAPGLFVWVIPENKEMARVGLMTDKNPNKYFERFIRRRFDKVKIKNRIGDVIKYGLIEKSVSANTLLVGDAACMVKPFSIDANEPIILLKDNLIRTQIIGEFVEDEMRKNGAIRINNGQSEYFKTHIKDIYGYSPGKHTNTAQFRKVKRAFEHKINEDLYEIITDKGYRIRATGSHSVMVLNKNSLIPKEVSKLSIRKDHLVLAPNVPNNENLLRINLLELILKEAPELVNQIRVRGGKNLIFSKRSDIPLNLRATYCDRDSIPLTCFLEKGIVPENVKIVFNPPRKKVEIPNIIEITPEFCRLLGYYVAEGDCYAEKAVHMSFGKDDYKKGRIDDFINCVKKVFKVHVSKWKPLKNPKTNKKSTFPLSFGGKLLAKIFVRVFKCGKNASSKQIPFIIFNVPNKYKMEFLKGYLRGDGWLRIRTPKKRRNWSSEIGAKSLSRKLVSDLVVLSLQLGLFPSISESVSKERFIFGYKIKEGSYYVIVFSRKKDLKKLVNIFPERKSELIRYLNKIKSKSKGLPFILPLTIREIRRLKPTKNKVFDIEIPETNIFVGGVGPILLHNSAGGLIYGQIGAEYAGKACIKSLEANDFSEKFLLENYDKQWKGELAWPIRKGLIMKKVFDSLGPFSFKLIKNLGLTKLSSSLDMDFLGKG